MDQQDGGFVAFSVPSPPHRSQNAPFKELEKRIISSLRGQNDGMKVPALVRMVGVKKKAINHTLYELEKRGVVRKVHDQPPIWLLLGTGLGQGNTQMSHGYHRESEGRTRGRVDRGRRGRGRDKRGRGNWGGGNRFPGHHQEYMQGSRGPPLGFNDLGPPMGYGGSGYKGQGRGFIPPGQGFPGESWTNNHTGYRGRYNGMGISSGSSGFRDGSTWSQEDTGQSRIADEGGSGEGTLSKVDPVAETMDHNEGNIDVSRDHDGPENQCSQSSVEESPEEGSSTNDEQSGTSSSDDPLVSQMDYTEMWSEMSKCGPQQGESPWGQEGTNTEDMTGDGRCDGVKMEHSTEDWPRPDVSGARPVTGELALRYGAGVHPDDYLGEIKTEAVEESRHDEERISPDQMEVTESATAGGTIPRVPPGDFPTLDQPGVPAEPFSSGSKLCPDLVTWGGEPPPKRLETSQGCGPYSSHQSPERCAGESSAGLSIPVFPHQMLDASRGEIMGGRGFGRGLPQGEQSENEATGVGRGLHGTTSPSRMGSGFGRGLSKSSKEESGRNFVHPGFGRGMGRLIQSALPERFPGITQPSRLPPQQLSQQPSQLPIPPTSGTGVGGSQMTLEQRILQTLSDGRTLTTVDLARLVIGKRATSREVNPTLYGLERRGLVRKVQDQPPKWCSSAPPGGPQNIGNGGDSSLPRPPGESIPATRPGSRREHEDCGMDYSSQGQMVSQGMEDSSGPRLGGGTGMDHPRGSVPLAPATRTGGSNFGLEQMTASIPQPPDLLLRGQPSSFQPLPGSSSSPYQSPPVYPTPTVGGGLPPGGGPANDVAETMRMLNKNPISAFMEFAQSVQQQPSLELVGQSGPSHRPKFTFIARVGRRAFPPVVTNNKKEGRREAAEAALRALAAEGAFQATPSKTAQPGFGGTTFFDGIATLAHHTFNNLVVNIPECFSGKKVIAALILKTDDGDEGRVIALGTGNRCLTGDKLSLEGQAVHDSHAEVVTRRAFMGYLYRQLRMYHTNPRQTILTEGHSGRLRLKDGHTLHLYISTAPCGDGAQFSWTDDQGNQEGPSQSLEFSGCAHHTPTIEKNIQGLLRTKMELGEGTIPIQEKNPIQTWDAILQNQQRLRTMSCSDKVCRWNILGLQGALLSNFVEPIYMSSLTLGALYHHGHLSRAVCCRLDHYRKTVGDLAGELPSGYRINHPQLGHVTSPDPPRGTEKTKEFSVNWFAGCAQAEVTDGTVGRIKGVVPSRLCKMNLLKEYMGVCALYGRAPPQDDAESYNDMKLTNHEFQQAKGVMTSLFRRGKAGTWVKKPVEVGMFHPY